MPRGVGRPAVHGPGHHGAAAVARHEVRRRPHAPVPPRRDLQADHGHRKRAGRPDVPRGPALPGPRPSRVRDQVPRGPGGAPGEGGAIGDCRHERAQG